MSEVSHDNSLPTVPWNVYGYTALVSFSSFVYGYNTGMIAPAIIFIPDTIAMSMWQTSMVVSIVLVGAMVGASMSGLLADRLGRKRVLAGNNLVMLAAAIVASLGTKSGWLICSRLVLGVGVGIASVVPSLFITEVAPPHIRGKLGAYNQFNGWLGIIVAYFVGYKTVGYTTVAYCWRYMFASGATLCIFHWMLVTTMLPDTPRWLVSQGRCKDALTLLAKIYGEEQEEVIIREYQLLCDRDTHREPHFFSMDELKSAKNRLPLVIAAVMQLVQQCSGYSALVYYSTYVFYQLGFTATRALLYNAITCVPQLAVLVGVVFWLDQHGRKPALLVSEAGVTISLMLIGFAMIAEPGLVQSWLFLTGLVLHRVFFAIGLGPVPSVLAAEILPFSIRGRGMSATLSMGWALNFFITATFPLIFALTPPYLIYFYFAGLTALGFIFTYFVVAETKGKTLELIEGHVSSSSEQDSIDGRIFSVTSCDVPSLQSTPLHPNPSHPDSATC